MKVKRIISNIETKNLNKTEVFYSDIFGLELFMDHGWIRTYGSDAAMNVQVSFASEGGSGTLVPDLSIEVEDIESIVARVRTANIPIE